MSVAAWLDGLRGDHAALALMRCNGSTRWIIDMLVDRPFGTDAALLAAADRHWADASRDDVVEAIGHHPRIGADLDKLRAKFAATASWSGTEQAGVAAADEATLRALRDGNLAYEAKFGFVFLVCATGKSAAEMLALLEARLDNDPATEWQVARGEQAKITRIRLEKLQPMPSPLTTHVLDTARGRPAAGLLITLEIQEDDVWIPVAEGTTDDDGRITDLLPPGGLKAATYRMTFETGEWFAATGQDGFYPEASVVFRVDSPDEHYHVPLLLSPFGYSTYRGS